MSADEPERKKEDAFDVVWMHGPTDDGTGARVLRARPGRIEAGEVRPMSHGRPIAAGADVVRLERRPGAPALFDVKVECTVPEGAHGEAEPPRQAPCHGRPPQVATRAYRDNWEVTFGAARERRALN